MTDPHPKAQKVRERFLELLPRRLELSRKLFGSAHGLSTSRLFVLLALCEAEIPTQEAIRAMARELPPDFPVVRVRSMRFRTLVSQVLLKLKRRGFVTHVKRDGIIRYEPNDQVRRILGDPGGPASSADDPAGDADESQADDPDAGNRRGNSAPGGPGDPQPDSRSEGGANETT